MKHVTAKKLQAKLHFLSGFWQDQELPWEKLERMQVYGAWHLCDQRERGYRHKSNTRKARVEQGKGVPMPYLSPAPKGCPPSARSCSSVLLFTSYQWTKHQNYLVQFFSQPKSHVKKAGSEPHFWEHNWFLSCSASFVVSVSQIFHLSLAKQQVPEKVLSQVTPRKVFSDTQWAVTQTLLYLTSTKCSLKPSFQITSI